MFPEKRFRIVKQNGKFIPEEKIWTLCHPLCGEWEYFVYPGRITPISFNTLEEARAWLNGEDEKSEVVWP